MHSKGFVLYWKSQINISRWKTYKFISIPENISSLTISNASESCDGVLNLIWIHDNYPLKQWQFISLGCSNVNFSIFHECSNFTSLRKMHIKYFILLVQNIVYSIPNYNSINKHKLNLLETPEVCQDVGGYLPYLSRKIEIEEVIALLKLRRDIPPMEAVFIGLNRSKEQVTILHE